jgi:hypothetical protein
VNAILTRVAVLLGSAALLSCLSIVAVGANAVDATGAVALGGQTVCPNTTWYEYGNCGL